MSHHQNWNEMSSSSDEDSWFDDEKQQEQPSTNKPEHPQEHSNKPPRLSKEHPETKEQQPPRTVRDQGNTGSEVRPQRRRFPTDEELLNQYISKTVDDPKAIKVTKCYNEDAKEVVKNIKNAKVREVNQSTFLLFFETQEHLIQFFKEKIANRYKFYFNMFEKRAPREPKEGEQRFRNRDDYNRKERRPLRTEKEQNERQPARQTERTERRATGEVEKRRKRYEAEDDPREERRRNEERQERIKNEERQEKRRNEERQEQRQKKANNSKHRHQLRQNHITILSDLFEVKSLLEDIHRKRVTSNFNKIHIKAPFRSFSRVSELCYQIGKLGYFLEKLPPAEADGYQIHELILVQKGINKTDSFYERFHQKKQDRLPKQTNQSPRETKQSPKETRQLPKQVKQSSKEKMQPIKQGKEPVRQEKQLPKQTKQLPKCRLLGARFQDYFKDLQKYNFSQIVKGFEENEYIKRLKEASQSIQKNWNSWNITAEQDSIEVLLKLTNRIKKSTIYEIELKPSLRNQKALLTAELRERPEKERRPKVDVSNVNSYLS